MCVLIYLKTIEKGAELTFFLCQFFMLKILRRVTNIFVFSFNYLHSLGFGLCLVFHTFVTINRKKFLFFLARSQLLRNPKKKIVFTFLLFHFDFQQTQSEGKRCNFTATMATCDIAKCLCAKLLCIKCAFLYIIAVTG